MQMEVSISGCDQPDGIFAEAVRSRSGVQNPWKVVPTMTGFVWPAGFSAPVSLYTLHTLQIASIESAGMVPTSS
jgi:hypothetical protein